MYSSFVLMSQLTFSLHGGVVKEPLYLYVRLRKSFWCTVYVECEHVPPDIAIEKLLYNLSEEKWSCCCCIARLCYSSDGGEDRLEDWIGASCLLAELDQEGRHGICLGWRNS